MRASSPTALALGCQGSIFLVEQRNFRLHGGLGEVVFSGDGEITGDEATVRGFAELNARTAP